MAATSTTAATSSTQRPSTDDSITNVWLSPAAREKPVLVASAEPDRLWLFSVLPVDSGIVLVQGDDEDHGYLSYYENGDRRWQRQLDRYVTSAAFVGDAVVAAMRAANGVGTDLVVYPLADGALLQHATLSGEYVLRTVGGTVYLLGGTESSVALARLDPKALEAVDTLTVPGGGGVIEVDRGLLAWNAAGTGLIDLDTWTTTRWAIGQGRESIAPAVLGTTLVRAPSPGEVVGYATDGSREWSVTDLGADVTGLAALGATRLAVATPRGVELVAIDGMSATVIDRWEVAGTLGPTATIDGRGYLVWFAGTSGYLLADSGNGLVELATFPAGVGQMGPTGATFVDGALYVTAATDSDEPGPASEVPLAALSLADGHELWSIRPSTDVRANVRWSVESGVIVARYGYALIPDLVEVYR